MRKATKVIIFAAAVCGLLYFFYGRLPYDYPRFDLDSISRRLAREAPFPAPERPKQIKLEWNYRGERYAIEKTLYGSIYDYYRQKSKDISYLFRLPADWEEKYYAQFLLEPSQDDLITGLTSQLRALAEQHGLDPDQTAEMALAMVQSIPYDEAKAKLILSDDNQEGGDPRFAYETIYDNSGVCSDKSILAWQLMRGLGYGVAFFEYEQARHIAIGIECPADLSNYGSSYCYGETTTPGHPIGIIPQVGQDSKARSKDKMKYFSEGDIQSDAIALGEAKIINQTDGRSYEGVRNTLADIARLDSLGKELQILRPRLIAQKGELEAQDQAISVQEKQMDLLKAAGNIKKFNNLVDPYNQLVYAYREDVKGYNSNIKKYNALVNEYNALITKLYKA